MKTIGQFLVNWRERRRGRLQQQLDRAIATMRLDPEGHYILIFDARYISRRTADRLGNLIYEKWGIKVMKLRMRGPVHEVMHAVKLTPS